MLASIKEIANVGHGMSSRNFQHQLLYILIVTFN